MNNSYHTFLRLEAASFIIRSVEKARPSLAQLIYAAPKRRRASHLVDEAKRVVDILASDIGLEGKDAWTVLLNRYVTCLFHASE